MILSNIEHNIPISFIIPVYNVKPYIERCLESIIRVNIEKEIILIEDGSTDGSREILENYQKKYPYITLVCQKNSGVSAARNVGIKLAKGKYIQFVDSDDYLLNDDYQKLMALIESYNIDLLRGKYQFIFGDKFHEDRSVFSFKDNKMAIISSSERFLTEMNREFRFSPKICCGLFKTDIIKKYNLLFNETLYMGEDIVFVFDFLTTSKELKVMELALPLYGYALRNGSAAQNFTAKTTEGIFNLVDILWQRYYLYESKQENNICDNLFRMILGQYNSAYKIYYMNSDDTEKQKLKHLFTKKVINLLEEYYEYKVELE